MTKVAQRFGHVTKKKIWTKIKNFADYNVTKLTITKKKSCHQICQKSCIFDGGMVCLCQFWKSYAHTLYGLYNNSEGRWQKLGHMTKVAQKFGHVTWTSSRVLHTIGPWVITFPTPLPEPDPDPASHARLGRLRQSFNNSGDPTCFEDQMLGKSSKMMAKKLESSDSQNHSRM